MKSGAITGNTCIGGSGGGVNVSENAIFTMKGGEISGNTATENNGGNGGGVQVGRNATFTMEGGEISGNTANSCGGGVRLRGTFTMKGGKISGNTTKRGGGVDSWQGTFIMEGGEISGNSNTSESESGGGLYVGGENATFTKTGGIIYGDTDTTHTPGSTENTALNSRGHAVSLAHRIRRNATAGEEITLYAKNENGVWTYNDSSTGGVGDTTANWGN
ncbi:hypothetical protein AGMMS49579_03100 [Spirochaetia bacterium]|nr:hypothetical protein AGMMS49579_03100 [Spirochaetia bacterium]